MGQTKISFVLKRKKTRFGNWIFSVFFLASLPSCFSNSTSTRSQNLENIKTPEEKSEKSLPEIIAASLNIQSTAATLGITEVTGLAYFDFPNRTTLGERIRVVGSAFDQVKNIGLRIRPFGNQWKNSTFSLTIIETKPGVIDAILPSIDELSKVVTPWKESTIEYADLEIVSGDPNDMQAQTLVKHELLVLKFKPRIFTQNPAEKTLGYSVIPPQVATFVTFVMPDLSQIFAKASATDPLSLAQALSMRWTYLSLYATGLPTLLGTNTMAQDCAISTERSKPVLKAVIRPMNKTFAGNVITRYRPNRNAVDYSGPSGYPGIQQVNVNITEWLQKDASEDWNQYLQLAGANAVDRDPTRALFKIELEYGVCAMDQIGYFESTMPSNSGAITINLK